MVDRSRNPEIKDAIGRLLAALNGASDAPKSATAYLATQDLGDTLAYSCAVDGAKCARCPGQDGVILTVPKVGLDGAPFPASHGIAVMLFEHDRGVHAIHMCAEDAKQLVNRLGEAIAVAERIDAEGTAAR